MKTQTGFQPLTPSLKNSIRSETDTSSQPTISFGVLKRLANNFDETISLSSDILKQVQNEMRKEKRVRKRRKYNTNKKGYKPVKFIYLFKTKLNRLDDSNKLFKDITQLVN